MTDRRPDPDELLGAIARQEARRKRGILRVFFGMAAGVGKTYAMLNAGRQRKSEGIDVVVGVVETHGRSETAALLGGLPEIPRKKLEYRGTRLEEMDLDAVLGRKPAVVLVDELAHSNVPGSRHPKRWQDVLELLDGGIDVFTTMNVQHLESRKETLEQIVGITIRETVPDSVLERAMQIDLIDITPQELLVRFREGKVYLGPQAEAAQRNFFQEDRLTALREMALRFTAEKVDHQLQELRSTKEEPQDWKPVERLLVAISYSPHSEQVIRAAKNRAFELDVPWIALNVNTGVQFNEGDQRQLSRNVALARDLGAEIVTVSDTDLTSAIHRVARQKGVTQIVVGRPKRRWIRDTISGGTLLEQLVRKEKGLDIHVVRQENRHPSARRTDRPALRQEAVWAHYWLSLWVIGTVAVASGFLQPLIGYKSVGFLFLLSILAVGGFTSIGPVLFGSILATLVWDFFFIPPHFTFHISEFDDVVMCISFLFAASVTGILTHRIRRREQLVRIQNERMELLVEFAREVAEEGSQDVYLPKIARRLHSILRGAVAFFIPDSGDRFRIYGVDEERMSEDKRQAVARWVLEHSRPAGWSTDTLGGAKALYLPLKSPRRTVGVMAFAPDRQVPLLEEEMNVLTSVADQLAISIERGRLEEVEQEAKRLEQSERLHQATLSSVSHELRTPLTAMMGVASALKTSETWDNDLLRGQLLDDLMASVDRLNLVVGNLLDMSRLDAGRMELRKDWHDLSEVVAFSLRSLKEQLRHHLLLLRLPAELPLLRIDFHLLEQAVRNLILNAGKYSDKGTTIEIEASQLEGMIRLSIYDQGPGIPQEQKSRIFEKFYRLPGSSNGGLGLGLSIAKGIVEAHGGSIQVSDGELKGTVFSILLPTEKTPPMLEPDRTENESANSTDRG